MKLYNKLTAMKRNFWSSMVCFNLIALFVTALASAQPVTIFNKANVAYKNEDYETAAKLYEQLIQQGNISSDVYFNLGNSYYKTENYGAAILNYERAKKFNVVADDIDYNLNLANMQCIDKIEPLPQVFYEKWFAEFIYSSTPDARAEMMVAALWMALIFFAIYIFVRRTSIRKSSFLAAVICLFWAAFCFLAASKQSSLINSRKDAIIMAESDYVKSSPDEKSANLFMLHSGTKVVILDNLQGWKKIKIANGNVGWVPEKSLEVI